MATQLLPIICEGQWVERAQSALPKGSSTWFSFYSSVLGGITTDPRLMTIPIDDHQVHRGHAVFDTANLANGKVFGLGFHIDRLLKSAKSARIEHSYTKEQLRTIILHTVAVAGKREDCLIRYWLSAGRGDFGISPRNCAGASFYVMVHEYKGKIGYVNGVKEYQVGVPLKPTLLATMKSTNYLINALTAMESEDNGGFVGVQVEESGYLAESSISNVGIVDKDGKLRAPRFDNILRGTTLLRAVELAQPLLENGTITGIDLEGTVHVDEVYEAREMIGFGGGGIYPIIEFNGRKIGGGQPGSVYKYLYDAVIEDYKNPLFTDEVPFSLYAHIVALKQSGATHCPVSGAPCTGTPAAAAGKCPHRAGAGAVTAVGGEEKPTKCPVTRLTRFIRKIAVPGSFLVGLGMGVAGLMAYQKYGNRR